MKNQSFSGSALCSSLPPAATDAISIVTRTDERASASGSNRIAARQLEKPPSTGPSDQAVWKRRLLSALRTIHVAGNAVASSPSRLSIGAGVVGAESLGDNGKTCVCEVGGGEAR